jgi:hypothetical protein
MKYEEELRDMKNAYLLAKESGKDEASLFLEGVVSHCRCLKFDLSKTTMILGMITGCEPIPSELWNDIRAYHEDEVNFNKSIKEKGEALP